MIEFIGSSILNYFSWVILGLLVAIVVHKLDNEGEDLVPIFVASIIGAVAGGFLANSIFGTGLSIFNLSSVLISITGAFWLAILVRVLRQKTEEEVQEPFPTGNESYEFAYFSDIKRPNSKPKITDFLDRVDYPISKRDLLRHVEQHQANSSEINLLEKLPDHIYQSKKEIINQMNGVS